MVYNYDKINGRNFSAPDTINVSSVMSEATIFEHPNLIKRMKLKIDTHKHISKAGKASDICMFARVAFLNFT